MVGHAQIIVGCCIYTHGMVDFNHCLVVRFDHWPAHGLLYQKLVAATTLSQTSLYGNAHWTLHLMLYFMNIPMFQKYVKEVQYVCPFLLNSLVFINSSIFSLFTKIWFFSFHFGLPHYLLSIPCCVFLSPSKLLDLPILWRPCRPTLSPMPHLPKNK